MKNIVLFGKPGAGKGTQAAILKKTFELVHISTGDVFRENIKGNSPLGVLAQSYMDKGELVPDSVTVDMLSAEVAKNPNANGFIFDGFPRTVAQAEALDALLDEKSMRVNATIGLVADDEVLIERLLERGKSSGRSDDTDAEKIITRFEEYNQKTAPLIAYYRNQNKYEEVKGIGEITEISTQLSAIIERI